MTTTVGLSCPVCGAPRAPGANRCEFCGSWLLATPDPSFPDDVREDVVREHVATYRARLDQNPADIVALHGLGVAYRNLGLLDDAVRTLVRAASLRPEALNIQRALAGTLHDAVRSQPQEQRMWRDVRRQADRIIALDPESAEGWWLRSMAALRMHEHAALLAVIPGLAHHDSEGDHRVIIDYLGDTGARQLRDWQWPAAVESWNALAKLDDMAGRTALVGFLLQNARLVPRSMGNVWRAVRQTMTLRGDFRQSTFAAIALGIALAFVVTALSLVLARSLFPAVLVIGVVAWPILAWLAVRWRLLGWPPFVTPHPWHDIETREIVDAARTIAPLVNRIRPGG